MKKRKAARRSRAFWIALVARWQQSGQSYRAFAEAQGVSVHTLQYWVYKLRDEAPGRRQPPQPAFVEVERALPGVRAQPACRLQLGHGWVLELAELPPPAWLRELC
jgi:transposase-like protein